MSPYSFRRFSIAKGHIRFALIENEQRIGQAVRHLRAALTKLG